MAFAASYFSLLNPEDDVGVAEVAAEADVDRREVWPDMAERNSFLQQCKWSMLAATDGVTRVLGSPLREGKGETLTVVGSD